MKPVTIAKVSNLCIFYYSHGPNVTWPDKKRLIAFLIALLCLPVTLYIMVYNMLP